MPKKNRIKLSIQTDSILSFSISLLVCHYSMWIFRIWFISLLSASINRKQIWIDFFLLQLIHLEWDGNAANRKNAPRFCCWCQKTNLNSTMVNCYLRSQFFPFFKFYFIILNILMYKNIVSYSYFNVECSVVHILKFRCHPHWVSNYGYFAILKSENCNMEVLLTFDTFELFLLISFRIFQMKSPLHNRFQNYYFFFSSMCYLKVFALLFSPKKKTTVESE